MGATEDDAWRRFAAARTRRTLPGTPLLAERERIGVDARAEAQLEQPVPRDQAVDERVEPVGVDADRVARPSVHERPHGAVAAEHEIHRAGTVVEPQARV